MATSSLNVQPTSFPRLDTLAAALPQEPSRHERQQRLRRRQFSYATNPAAQPKGKTALLRDYSRFIASFTGESDVCFQFALCNDFQAEAKPEIVLASVLERPTSANSGNQNGDDCIIETNKQQNTDSRFDFGLELLADPDNFDSISVLPSLDCPFVVQYHASELTLVLLYDPAYLDDSLAEVAWNVLIKQLSRKLTSHTESEQKLSVLNHPPLLHPPPLSQIGKGTLPNGLLHAGFQRSAARWPNRAALHFHTESTDDIFTYAELDDLTTAFALRLRDHIPVRPDWPESSAVVPAYMSNSTAFYVSWLSVLKAGFAFCPLPVDAPPEQLRGIVEEVGASLVLTNGPQVGGRPWDAWYCDDDELATCLDVQEFIRQWAFERPVADRQLPEIRDNDLAYVMYTSGSTGKPKGVKIHHHAAACSIASHSKFIPTSFFKDGFRWFQFAAPTFDPSIMEIFTTWWTGGTLCGAPRDMLLTDPENAINQVSATIMMATPSMASVLRPENVPSLRHLWTMGEKLTPKVIQNFSSDSPSNSPSSSHTPSLQRSRKLLNAYGPTEGSINCNIVPDFSCNERGSIIGQPIDTCSILIIDPSSRLPSPVPLGFSGELAIGGPQVSQGYLNRPEQTAAAFVTSPEYGRLYRTGDRARVVKTRTGELTVEFLGRLTSDQVKLSGRRVELGQIESAIASATGVTDAVAVVHQHGAAGQGSEQVVACIVSDGSKAEEDLISACRKSAEAMLAQFMQPSRYFVLESMPRSRSGKTDRKALGAIIEERWDTADVSAASSDSGYDSGLARSMVDAATMSTVVNTIATVSEVDIGAISAGTELLSLGIDSLRAVRLLQQLRDNGISHLTVADVLSSRTVQGLANNCAQGESRSPQTSQVDWDAKLGAFSQRHLQPCASHLGIAATDIAKVLPTTATQSGMIASFLRSVSKQTASSARKRYINHSVYYQSQDVDATKLEQAWRTALSRPEILRTVFAPVDDELSPFGQCILQADATPAKLEIQEFTCSSQDEWKNTLKRAEAEVEASITLDKPPFRLCILKSPDQTAYLLSLFHAIFDGGSLELILQDVEDAYFGREPASRTDISAAVEKHFSEATEDTVKYWKSEFKDFELIPFPCVSASKPETQSPDASVAEVIGNVTLDKLAQAAKKASVSPLSLLQAAWASVLFAYTGSTTDVSFGSVVSNRLEDDLSSCIAPTFVVAPSRIAASTKSALDIMSHLTSKNAEALPYHHIPLSSLTTAEGHLPYDTLLAFQAFDKSVGSSSLWNTVIYPPMEHDFAIMIEVWPTENGPLRFRGTYTYQHLDPVAAKTMLQQLDDIANVLCERPDTSFQDVRFAVSEEVQSSIPVALNPVDDLPQSQQLLHAAFEKHALEKPESSALIFRQAMDGSRPDVEWTYGKLYSLARTFASRIVGDFGSVTNEPIMICMEKCAELYVAILGVLLAGAGWCPIDPYSPPARQHAIMERTGSRLLILSPTASNVSIEAIPQGVSTLTVDLTDIETNDAKTQQLQVERDPAHLAYLIFTSGTTGLPKGVPITHKAGATAMHALADSIPSNVNGGVVRCMQFSQYTFDVFVQDLFYTWTLGGTVISSTRQIMIQNFADLANDTKATHAHLTPAFSATLNRSSVKTLEVVTMIGEKLTEAVAADWGTDMRAYNTYGPAEATVVSTLRQFTGKSDTYHSSNVGVPLPSVGTCVVQDENIVMRGGIGELALSGPQLSPGYWKLPEVNAKKFIWNEKLQERLYLTGDLVRHLADGTLNFVGRNDDLVKLGGIRVELGEIAFALRDADPRIEKFEVLHCKRKNAEEKLVVAFMACPSLAGSADRVEALTFPAARELANVAREYGRKVLPPYMLPTTFIVLPRIPRTASAKVDRAAMTAIYHGLDLASWEGADEASNVASKDQHSAWREENGGLLKIIADSLRVSMTSLHPASSLPAIGIDSIGAIRLIPKINAVGYNLAVVDAFKCRTLSDLCELATSTAKRPEQQQQDQHPDKILESFDARYYNAVSAYLEQDELSVIPTTVLQEGLLSESFKDAQAYWSSHLFQLEKDVDLNKLKKAWIKVARQTEALRVGFVAKAMLRLADDVSSQDDLSYLQVIYEEPELNWMEHKISEAVDAAAKERVAAIATYHHQQLFKLPLWAVDVFHQEDGTSVMMITIHHSIYDGPSLTFLEADVKAAYGRGAKDPQRLPLREAVAAKSAVDADNEQTKAFWKAALQDFEAESGEQDMADQAAAKLEHRILFHRSATSFSKLRSLAQELGLTSIVTILRTAWALVLTDLLESPQVLFAEILSDRIMDGKLENVIGPMMSTVPSLFKRKSTASETLVEQDKFSKSAFDHRNIRPGTIKALLNRGPTSHVYPAMFAFHPTGSDESNASQQQLWKRLEDATYLQVEHPLAFNVWQDNEPTPYFEMAVADNLMTEEEQNLLLRQLDALVAAMVQCPASSLPALTDTFPTELLSRTTPRKDTKCPSSLSPTHYVEHWAETHPDWMGAEIALKIDPEGNEIEGWTYAQFNAEANRVAHWILKEGVSKQIIGMCLGRTLLSYAVIIGIMKSGNCYLPIDESLPAERKAFLLEDSKSAFIITDSERFDDVDVPEGTRLVDVDAKEFQQEMAAQSTSNPVIEAESTDNCYLLYTSGSTGKPKGVLINRMNMASFVEAQCEFIYDVTTSEQTAGRGRWMGLASRAFDVHLGEAFLSWRFGISALTAPRAMLLDDLALALSSLRITHASFVPSLLDQTGLTPEDAPDLVYLGVGGEKMSPKTKKLWAGHERVGLINAYGPTEATIGLNSARLLPDSDMRDIGCPLGDSQAHILIPGTDNYALRNMPGELCFTGSLIGNGYLNRPDAKGFVEDFHGKRMYRTGDIVKLGLDEHVYFLGRKDDQVKIRGQRVELGEVAEGVRTASPVDINTAALVVKHAELSRVQLVAFIAATSSKNKSQLPPQILKSELQDANTTLRSRCQKTLPSSTVPDLIVPLSYIPLAATSGKADNKLLVKIFSEVPINDLMPRGADGGPTNAAINRPMNDAEKQVWDIVSSVLREQPQNVTPGSTVFELGIDSLSGISVFSKLRAAGYNCSVAMVMKNPTIEQLAQSTMQESNDEPGKLLKVRQELAEIEKQYLATAPNAADVQNVRPCLPLQEVLVAQSLHQSLDGEDGAYVNHIRFKLDADTDIERLRAAWEKLVQDNEIFRTCFSTADDKFLQVVLKPAAWSLPWQERAAVDDVQALQREVGKAVVGSLTTKPPMRLTLLPSEEGRILLLSIHHALYDGNSLEMMIHDVQALYDDTKVETRPGAAPLVEYIAGQDKSRLEQHWTTLLEDWQNAPLLTENSTKNIVLHEAKRHISGKLSSIESEVASLNITFATLLQLAFAIAMSQSLQTNDFIFGNVLSGRTIPVENADKIMAPCITTIPQRLRLEDGDTPISAVLAALQSSNSSSLEFQHVSPRDIQKWTKADRALYDTLFSFIRVESQDGTASTVFKQAGSDIGVDYPLAVEFEANANTDELIVRAGFTETFGSQADADLLLEKIEMLIDTIVHHSETTAGSFGIPITAGGKAVAHKEEFDEANWTPLEEQVKSLISEHTGVPQSDIHKDTAFIHLGIDSISAIRFAKKLRSSGLKVSSADIIRHNRIGSLCRHLDSSEATQQVSKKAETPSTTQEDLIAALAAEGVTSLEKDVQCYECTPLQSGMLAQSLATEGALYMHHHATRCSSSLDLTRLKAAWDSLVQELDVLRTTFYWLPKSKTPWVAVVHQDKAPSWQEIEVPDAREYWLKLTEKSDFMDRLQKSEPLADVRVVKDGEGIVLILTLHHAIYDGISLGMLYRRLAQRYLDQECSSITPFHEAARAIMQNSKAAVKFWADQVGEYEGAPSIPTPSEPTYTLSERVISEDAAALDDKCRAADADIKDICVAAFGKALACLHGRRDVVFGHVMAARHSQIGDGNDIIGPMFNTVPFRVAMKDQFMTNKDLVQRVHAVNTGSIEYQHAPLAEVQKLWRTSASDPGAQLIDSIFVYSKIEGQDSRAAEVYGKPLETDKSPVPSEYRLNFEVEHTSEGLVARALSSTSREELELLLDHFRDSIHDMLDQPGRFATAFPSQLRSLPAETKKEAPIEEKFDETAVQSYADVIRTAMAEVAQVSADKITLNSSIYSFGIDSIAAIQIVSRCKKAGVRLSVADILKGAMLGRICEIVAAKNEKLAKDKPDAEKTQAELVTFKDKTAALATLRPERDAVEDILPCLPGQEYHLISWLQSGRTLYEPGWCYRATARLDTERLRAAWTKLRERNSVLRTTFAAVSPTRAVQVVLKATALTEDGFTAIDDSRSLVDAVKDKALEEARKPSDFFSLPVRLRLIKAADGDAVMVYVHHSLYDAWSMPRLVAELASVYNGEQVEQSPSFAHLIQHTVDSIDRDEERKFWQDSLAGCEKAIVPSSTQPADDLDRSQSFAMTECTRVAVTDLESACAKHSISPHHVVLLAFARALAQVTNTVSPLFGFFQLGRSAAFDGIDKVTGPCVNALPLGLQSVLTRPVLEALRELQKVLGARVPFEQSSLRTAVEAFDSSATQIPFNAYINLLWHKASLVGEVSEKDLFQPLPIGVPTDYSSPQALPGRTAVDALDTSFLQPHQLFLDVGPGEKGIVFGARADAALMSADGIREFMEKVEGQVMECMEALQ